MRLPQSGKWILGFTQIHRPVLSTFWKNIFKQLVYLTISLSLSLSLYIYIYI